METLKQLLSNWVPVGPPSWIVQLHALHHLEQAVSLVGVHPCDADGVDVLTVSVLTAGKPLMARLPTVHQPVVVAFGRQLQVDGPSCRLKDATFENMSIST